MTLTATTKPNTLALLAEEFNAIKLSAREEQSKLRTESKGYRLARYQEEIANVIEGLMDAANDNMQDGRELSQSAYLARAVAAQMVRIQEQAYADGLIAAQNAISALR